MKKMRFLPVLMTLVLAFTFTSCGGDAADGDDVSGDDAANQTMTTDAFIAEANELGKEAFEEKYPKDSEIELQGKIVTAAVWGDKVNAKFGTGLMDCPVKADFMFVDNGGDKESTREKVKIGNEVHFKGTISFSFFKEDGKLKYVELKDCTTL